MTIRTAGEQLTIPEEVIHDWYREAQFDQIITLNKHEPHNCAWHVMGRKQ